MAFVFSVCRNGEKEDGKQLLCLFGYVLPCRLVCSSQRRRLITIHIVPGFEVLGSLPDGSFVGMKVSLIRFLVASDGVVILLDCLLGSIFQFIDSLTRLMLSPQQVSPECVCFADLGKVSSTISWDQATALLMGLARGSHPVFNCRTHSSELRLCLCPLGYPAMWRWCRIRCLWIRSTSCAWRRGCGRYS